MNLRLKSRLPEVITTTTVNQNTKQYGSFHRYNEFRPFARSIGGRLKHLKLGIGVLKISEAYLIFLKNFDLMFAIIIWYNLLEVFNDTSLELDVVLNHLHGVVDCIKI